MATRSETWQNAMSGILAVCAIAALGILLLGSTTPPPTSPNSGPPAPIEDWEALAGVGHRIGPDNAIVTIVEFGDYECPVCATFELSTLRPFLSANPGQAALVYRHWPLNYHRFAYPAARASECAADQGLFDEYHAILYEKQDSLGLKSFHEMAVEVGMPDIASFDRCSSADGVVDNIERDMAEAKARGGTGTPTIFVNGMRYYGLPTRAELDSTLLAATSRVRR